MALGLAASGVLGSVGSVQNSIITLAIQITDL